MPTVSRQLTVNIQSPEVWTQFKEGSGGVAYTVPTSGCNPRADVRLIRAVSTSGSAAIEVAFSPNSTIADDERVWSRQVVLASGQITDDSVHVLRSAEGIWAKASVTSGSPNITMRASLLEVT